MIRSIEKFIKNFHGWNFPLDLNLLCKNLNTKIERSNLPDYIKGYYNREIGSIVLNSNLTHHNERFIISREIRQISSRYFKSNIEKNYFAQELLMPTNEFIRKWNESYPTQVSECSWYFDVSKEAIINKAKRLYEKGFLLNFTYKHFSDIFENIQKKS